MAQAVLDCDIEDLETLQCLLDEREPLIAALQTMRLQDFGEEEQSELQALLDEVKRADAQIASRFDAAHQLQAEALRHLGRGRQALAGYKFPTIPHDQGELENRG